MAEIALLIKGMSCTGCAYHVTDALQSVPGVRNVTVNLIEAVAEVVYDPEQADLFRMMGAVAMAGYEARPLDPGGAEPRATPRIVPDESGLAVPILARVTGAVALLALHLGLIHMDEHAQRRNGLRHDRDRHLAP